MSTDLDKEQRMSSNVDLEPGTRVLMGLELGPGQIGDSF